jgi:hypothetical protein
LSADIQKGFKRFKRIGCLMGWKYDEMTPLPIDPERVVIFKLSTGIKRNWYVRIKRSEGKGYYQKSLKTEEQSIAEERAQKIYLDLWSSESKGVKYVDKKFSPLFKQFIDESGLSEYRMLRFKSTFSRYFLPFFGHVELNRIDSKLYTEFVQWRCNYWREMRESGKLEEERRDTNKRLSHFSETPTLTTLKHERQQMKQFLRWACDKRLIDSVPPFKIDFGRFSNGAFRKDRQRAKSVPDAHDKLIEERLYQYCVKESEKEKNWIRCYGRKRLYYFIYICRHALIRPSTEATALRWRDVEFTESKKYESEGLQLAIILVSESKTGKPRTVVLPYHYVRLLLEWKDILMQYKLYDYDGYVFPKHSGAFERSHPQQMGRLLKARLIDWNLHRLRQDLGSDIKEDRRHITLYSLVRHTGITKRIEESKWDVGTVAQMAGTSIFQISSFYHESFIKQDPDRYAYTLGKDGKTPILRDKTKEYVKNRLELLEDELSKLNIDD